ncbi:hypothetical protein T484DRAFT_3474338 [Baffinella frigidus]|nr:hypothetical protein T484DRAFT_3474338 [Cryptophyta sp. CCMP2293]
MFDIGGGEQVFEAAGEGGMKWLERLVEEEGFAVHMTDDYGATALHYAAINSRLEIMQWLVTEGVGVNLEDSAGCTPLAWLIMARNVESGKDKKLWSKEAQAAHAWLVKQGAVARYLPMFPATV